MSVIAFIPARGGSQRVPNKNMRQIGGLTLVDRAIRAARHVSSRIIVATDSHAIKKVVAWYDQRVVEVLHRDEDVSGPDMTLDELVAWWLAQDSDVGVDDTIVILLPTCPFVQSYTLSKALKKHSETGHTMLAGVRVHETYWRRDDAHVVHRFSENRNSQFAREAYLESGAFSIFTRETFEKRNTRRSWDAEIFPVSKLEAFDIDDEEDIAMARMIAPLVGDNA